MILRHLYLHVPFCLRRCSYCDFAVHPTRKPPIKEWLSAIAEELRLTLDQGEWSALNLSTVYVGGGTPSLLDAGAMHELRATLEQQGTISSDVEWTAEANPETFTDTIARDWKDAGVNRISLGVQSFHPAALRWMGRLHGEEGARSAMAAARMAGFDNVSIDLIFGLPQKLERDWYHDIELALSLDPDHVSLYGLTAEKGAALGRWVTEGRAVLPAEETYSEEFMTAARMLPAAGYVHYEVSNFAKPGFESMHNRAYWNGSPYLGLGPGAHSYRPPVRFWNVRDWNVYQTRLANGELPLEDREIVEHYAEALERVWLGLRTREGVDLPKRTAALDAKLRQWQEAGWAELEGRQVRLTPEGWLLLDRLAVELESAVTLAESAASRDI